MSRFLDNVISSLRSLYFAIISFVLIYAYVSVSLFEHNQNLSNLIALDKLLALRYVAKPPPFINAEEATLKELPQFFSRANDEYLQEFRRWEKQLDADFDAAANPNSSVHDKSAADEIKGFTDTKIPGVSILQDVPMRLAVGAVCNLLITQLLPGHNFNFATLQVVGSTYNVESQNTRLISFGNCEPGQRKEFNALVFSLPDKQLAIAIPKSLEEQFPGLTPPLPFTSFIFQEIDDAKKVLPPEIAKYVRLDEPFVTLHIRAMDYYILKYADARLAKYFRADELEIAAGKLYEEKEKEASYYGVTATSTLLVRFGPLIYFALSFELWRRVRLLPIGKISSDEYWFAFEIHDWLGRIYAYLCAAAPLLFGIAVYVLFAVSQNLSQIIFGYNVSLQGLIHFQFPLAPPEGWIVTDPFAGAIELFLVIHFVMLFWTARKLVRVVRAQIRRDRTRSVRRTKII
jgi:hypothetical protein